MYSYEICAGYSTMDASLHMKIPAILDCFQDAAIFEAENGKITVAYLYGRQLAWLLSSWQIVIDRQPKLNEKIKIATAPYDFKGFLGYRNFMMTGEDGAVIVRAASIWTLMNTKKMCPSRLTQELQEGYHMEEKIDMDYAPRKIVLSGEARAQEQFKVRKFQIDSNQHMNNVVYIKFAMEMLPENVRIRELRAEYKRPALLGEKIITELYQLEDKYQVVLKNMDEYIYAVVEFLVSEKREMEI
ncbi:hypothetical protein IMSAGC011_00449 [Lachnospiraceae bacterium]|nr:hypothetical protein IMSAGC011_00449 [Lachnospiraceae bacterium]